MQINIIKQFKRFIGIMIQQYSIHCAFLSIRFKIWHYQYHIPYLISHICAEYFRIYAQVLGHLHYRVWGLGQEKFVDVGDFTDKMSERINDVTTKELPNLQLRLNQWRK